MKKRFLIVSIVVLLAAALVGGIAIVASSNESARAKAFKDTPFYEKGEVKEAKDDAVSQLHPGLTPFSVGDGYLYWTGENGRVEMITPEDGGNEEETADSGQSQAKDVIVNIAEEWFDKAFASAEEQFGSVKDVQVSGAEMNDYVITINLLWNGKETGNSASIVVSKTGKLQAATFVYSELTAEELGKAESVSEEDAESIARDNIKVYAENKSIVATSEEDVTEIWETEYRVFKGTRYYLVRGQVLFSKTQKWGTSDMPFEIKVNADTGECMEIATILE